MCQNMKVLNAKISRRCMPKYENITVQNMKMLNAKNQEDTCQNLKEFIWNQGYQNEERKFNLQLLERKQLSTF